MSSSRREGRGAKGREEHDEHYVMKEFEGTLTKLVGI